MNRFCWWYHKRKIHKKIHKHFINRYHMKLVSEFTGIPLSIFNGTKAGKLESGQLSTSLYDEIGKEKYIEYMEQSRRLFNKWFSEQNENNL